MNSLNRTIFQGDVFEQFKKIPDESIDCIITSPPYWHQRNYEVEGQIGLESMVKEFMQIMRLFMNDCRRVLKSTGSCWINLGDTYATTETRDMTDLEPKCRIGIPERFYVDCIDDGWIARNHIPWVKGNAMPSSVKDRFTNKWESLFFFVKEQKYYFNLDAVRVKTTTKFKPFNVRVRDAKKGMSQAKLWSGMSEKEDEEYNKKGERIINEKYKDNPNSNVCRLHKDRKGNPNKIKHANTPGQTPQSGIVGHSGVYKADGTSLNNPKGKNPGDVFYINPKPFPEAHYATFPPALPEKIIKCAVPKKVCVKCGYPVMSDVDEASCCMKCSGDVGQKTGIVLDPFLGAGTTALAAEQLGVQWCGIELNPKSVKITEKRLKNLMMDDITGGK